MTAASLPRTCRTIIPAISLVTGPLLMTVGDLLHPEERIAASEQATILAAHADRWYVAHLLLFLGMLLLVPGLLTLSGLAAERRPVLGNAARVLILIGLAAMTCSSSKPAATAGCGRTPTANRASSTPSASSSARGASSTST